MMASASPSVARLKWVRFPIRRGREQAQGVQPGVPAAGTAASSDGRRACRGSRSAVPARAVVRVAYEGAAARRGCGSQDQLAKTFQRHLEGIRTMLAHANSNAMAESFNADIHGAIARARGFRTFRNLRTIVYLLKGDWIYPLRLSRWHRYGGKIIHTNVIEESLPAPAPARCPPHQAPAVFSAAADPCR